MIFNDEIDVGRCENKEDGFTPVPDFCVEVWDGIVDTYE